MHKKKPKLPPMGPSGDLKAKFEQYLQRDSSRGKKHIEEVLPIPVQEGPKNPSDANQSFTSSLLKRVSHLEKTLESYRRELKIKSKELIQLKDKVEFYEEYLDKTNKVDLERAREENIELKQQINYIQDFLAGYGLKWKGYTVEGEEGLEELKKDAEVCNQKPAFRNNLPKEVDIGTLAQRVNELNSIVLKELGANDIVVGKDGIRRFEKRRPRKIVFYKDGVHLESFPLFKYGSRQAVTLIADIYDGFFPKQLEKSYPEGVLLTIIDKLDERQNEQKKGKGGITTGQDIEGMPPMSKQEFLAKLPEKVIKDGKILDVRKDVGSLFEGKSPINEELLSKTQCFDLNERITKVAENTYAICSPLADKCIKDASLDFQKEGISMVKIRLKDSLTTLIYYSGKKETLGELKRAVRGALGWCEPVVVSQNFPRVELKDCDNSSLEQLQMFPRAAVHLKKLEF